MRYVISTRSSDGVYSNVEGKTPLSALNALGRNRHGKTHQGAHAIEHDDAGNVTLGYILRQGRLAYFEADK